MTQAVDSSAQETLVLRVYQKYTDAQRLVDALSDTGFPVEHVRIVGEGLQSIEQVTGRMTKGRATGYGAGAGAWFGLLVGLLLSLFATGSGVLGSVVGSLLIGAVWGALFGFTAQWATGGERDFSSEGRLAASRYVVSVDAAYFNEAKKIADRI